MEFGWPVLAAYTVVVVPLTYFIFAAFTNILLTIGSNTPKGVVRAVLGFLVYIIVALPTILGPATAYFLMLDGGGGISRLEITFGILLMVYPGACAAIHINRNLGLLRHYGFYLGF